MRNLFLTFVLVLSANFAQAQTVNMINGVTAVTGSLTLVEWEDVYTDSKATFYISYKEMVKALDVAFNENVSEVVLPVVIEKFNGDYIKHLNIQVRLQTYGKPGAKNRQVKFYTSESGIDFVQSVWITNKKAIKLFNKTFLK